MESMQKNTWLIELSNEDIWSDRTESIPSMIYYSYEQLKILAQQGQVYGVMLQCKDLYELLYKIPLIMSMIFLENDESNKEKKGYADIIKLALNEPMSMGRWNQLAEKFISKKNKTIILPDMLKKILKATHRLYEQRVSENSSDVVNWRNSTIGHGALKFEDDPSYQEEIRNLLFHLKKYFDNEYLDNDNHYGIYGLYDSAYFFCNETNLTGKCSKLSEIKDSIQLFIDKQPYNTENFISNEELSFYLFDSFLSKRNLIKYNSYTDGHDKITDNTYFSNLYKKYVLNGIDDFQVSSGAITREQEQILELLNMPVKYIKPDGLIEKLEEKIDELEHGIISIFMERGTGKSAFANQMSGLYHEHSLIKYSFSRSYHVHNASLRGISDFINMLNFNFTHSYHHLQDYVTDNDELPSITLKEEHPDLALANFLNFYHAKYGKDYTLLLIDGIDEITEQTKAILDFIPSADKLSEGVFIILLSRFKNESTVLGSSKLYIDKAINMSNAVIELNRDNEININVLKTCIEKWKKEQAARESIDMNELISRADKRFLYLKAYLELPPDVILDKSDESRFIQSFLEYVMSLYGPTQKMKFKEIAITIALFPSITLKQYQQYMNCPILTYEFMGMLNDLLPVLTVVHENGEDAFEFADNAFSDYIFKAFSDQLSTVFNFFGASFNKEFVEHLDIINALVMEHDHRADLGEAFSFFTKSVISIQHQALRNAAIAQIYFDQPAFWYFLTYLLNDTWSSFGNGYYYCNELITGIYSNFWYSIKHPEDDLAHEWVSSLINTMMYSHEMYPGGWRNFELKLHHNDSNSELAQYIITHIQDIREPELWFWILLEQEDQKEVAKCIIKHDLLNPFLESFETIRINNTALIDELLSCDIPAATAEKLLNDRLNNLLQLYLFLPNTESTESLLLLLEQMKTKKCKIIPKAAFKDIYDDDPSWRSTSGIKMSPNNDFIRIYKEFPNADFNSVYQSETNYKRIFDIDPDSETSIDILITKLKENSLLSFLIRPIINEAIGCLQDFNSPTLIIILKQYKNASLFYYDTTPPFSQEADHDFQFKNEEFYNGNKQTFCFPTFQIVETPILESYRHLQFASPDEDINKLHSAFYRRLEYENQCGRLKIFIAYNDTLKNHIINILKSISNDDDDLLQNIMTWIERIKPTVNFTDREPILILSRLYIEAIHMLEQANRNQEALRLKEDYILSLDTSAFFASFNYEYTTPNRIYCCKNTISLLSDYYNNHDTNHFIALNDLLKKTIPEIDNYFNSDNHAMSQLEECKWIYAKFRKECQLTDSFDDYLLASINETIHHLNQMIKILSPDNDLMDLTYEINRLLEFYYQTWELKEAVALCDKIIQKLILKETHPDKKFRLSISKLKSMVENYRLFFNYLMTASITNPQLFSGPPAYHENHYKSDELEKFLKCASQGTEYTFLPCNVYQYPLLPYKEFFIGGFLCEEDKLGEFTALLDSSSESNNEDELPF